MFKPSLPRPKPKGGRAAADGARDARSWARAAELYQRAYDEERDARLLVQAGNCFKEARRYREAYRAYAGAEAGLGADPDLFLQFGHLFKLSGNLRSAQVSYELAAALGSDLAADEARDLPMASVADIVAGLDVTGGSLSAGGVAALLRCEQRPLDADALAEVAAELEFDLKALSAAFAWMADLSGSRATPALSPEATQHLAEARLALGPSRKLAAIGEALAGGARSVSDEALADIAARGLRIPPIETRLDKLFAPATGGDEVVGLVRGLHAVVFGGPASGAPWPAVRDFAGGVRSAFSVFDQDHEPAELATRVLHNVLLAFLDRHSSLICVDFGGREDLKFALAMARADLDPFCAETSPLFGTPELFAESVELAAARVPRAGVGETALTAKLVLHLGFRLSDEQRLGLVRFYAERDDALLLQVAAAPLLAPDRIADRTLLIELARALKHGGAWSAAAELLERLTIDELFFDAFMELGFVQRARGRFAEAAAAFERCVGLDAKSEVAWRQLLSVVFEASPPGEVFKRLQRANMLHLVPDDRPLKRVAFGARGATIERGLFDRRGFALVEKGLLPAPTSGAPPLEEELDVHVGWNRVRTRFGRLPHLGGVDFVRARTVGREPVTSMRVRIDGRTIAEAAASAAPPGPVPSGMHTQYFNAWFDAGAIEPGYHELQLYFHERGSGFRRHEQIVYVGGVDRSDARHGAHVVIDEQFAATALEDRVVSAPAQVHDAGRSILKAEPGSILVVRADQLGDFITSLPAIAELRKGFPAAELTALVSPGVKPLAEQLGLFDAILSVALVNNPATGRRELSAQDQMALRAALGDRKFDLAIDLSPSDDTRPLLRLVEADFTVGFKPHRFPWLSFGMDIVSRDEVNGKEAISHASLISSLVTGFLGAVRHSPPVLPKSMNPQHLRQLGLEPQRFALLHSGARLEIKRWPLSSYAELAALILARTDLSVAMITDDRDAVMPQALASHPGFRDLRSPVSFDLLDDLSAGCAVFVGNDTGPKHLAAVRGAPVVSVHMGQVNWDEWGQEGRGRIVTKNVPCYGCGIEHPWQCGKNLICLTGIRPDEVFAAVEELIRAPAHPCGPETAPAAASSSARATTSASEPDL